MIFKDIQVAGKSFTLVMHPEVATPEMSVRFGVIKFAEQGIVKAFDREFQFGQEAEDSFVIFCRNGLEELCAKRYIWPLPWDVPVYPQPIPSA